jgi:hypothetical protein
VLFVTYGSYLRHAAALYKKQVEIQPIIVIVPQRRELGPPFRFVRCIRRLHKKRPILKPSLGDDNFG